MPISPAPSRPPRRPPPKPLNMPPRAPGALKFGRKMPWLGEVIERLKGDALGAVAVDDGMLKVRLPRLPNEPPPPARAKASAEKPAASIRATVKIKIL